MKSFVKSAAHALTHTDLADLGHGVKSVAVTSGQKTKSVVKSVPRPSLRSGAEKELQESFDHLMTFDPTVDTPEALQAAVAYNDACENIVTWAGKSNRRLYKVKDILCEHQRVLEARVPGITAHVKRITPEQQAQIVDLARTMVKG